MKEVVSAVFRFAGSAEETAVACLACVADIGNQGEVMEIDMIHAGALYRRIHAYIVKGNVQLRVAFVPIFN